MNKKTTIEIIIIAVLSIVLAVMVKVTVDSMSQAGGGQMQPPGQSSEQVTYKAVKEISEDTEIEGETIESTTSDENAILTTDEAKVTLNKVTVKKTGDSDGGDSTSFYGINSGIVAKSGSALTIKDSVVETSANGANGVFAYGGAATTSKAAGDGTSIDISNTSITTKQDQSGGIMVTGGGKLTARDLTVKTAGVSSAAIRSDRGGGTLDVTGGTYSTSGKGSPAIYSTADITVKDAKLTATNSEGAIIEGKNSITLDNVELTDTNSQLNGMSTTYKNIFIYQSGSGDAEEGEATFVAKDSNIVTNKGDSIYVTNTTARIELTGNTFVNKDEDGNFLRIQKDSWGTADQNGGDVTLLLKKQTVEGAIVVDSISTLDMTMESGSSFTGTINQDNQAKAITLKLDKSSKIKLTGDTYVTELEDADSSYSNIDFNGYKLYVNGESVK